MSDAEDALAWQIKTLKLSPPVRQYRFHETRKWRADFAWPNHRLLLEVDGGGFVAGRHGRGLGMEQDCEKTCAAVALGYRVMRVTPKMIDSGVAIDYLVTALGGLPETVHETREHGVKVSGADVA